MATREGPLSASGGTRWYFWIELEPGLDEEWLPSIRSSDRPTTWQHSRGMFDAHVRTAFGRTRLPDITPARRILGGDSPKRA